MGQDGRLVTWNLDSGKEAAIFATEAGTIFSADGEMRARIPGQPPYTNGEFWNGRPRTLAGHTGIVTCLAFSADGTILATGAWDRTVRIWNAENGVALRVLGPHDDPVRAIAVNGDGSRLVCATQTGELVLWDAEAARRLRTLAPKRNVAGIPGVVFASSPDGRTLAVANSKDAGTIQVYDLQTGKVRHLLTGHTRDVLALCYHPDGTRLLSASADRTLKAWDVATGKLLETFVGHTDAVNGVCVLPDGKRFVSGSANRSVRVWELPASK